MKRVVGGSDNGQVEGRPFIRPDVDRRAGEDKFWLDAIHPDVQLVSVGSEGRIRGHEGQKLAIKRFFNTLAQVLPEK